MMCFLFIGNEAFAEEILPKKTGNSARLVIMQKEASSAEDRPAVYQLKRWTVEEKTDPVKQALEVYKAKAEPRYHKRIWITDRKDGKRRVSIEYVAREGGEKVLFSPDEDFMYYLGITPAGQNMVYGVNLLSNAKFPLGTADNFNTVNCPGQKNYIVVQKGKERTVYHVYTQDGHSLRNLTNIQSPADLEKNLCR